MIKTTERKFLPNSIRGGKYYRASRNYFTWDGPGYLLEDDIHFSNRKKHNFFSLKHRVFRDDEE